MPSRQKKSKGEAALQSVPSKEMNPFPENFGPIFWENQFRTTIPLPTKEKYNATGKCAIVTGSNIGLGFEASRQLLSLGLSHLVMGVRSVERGNAAAAKLRAAAPSATIDVWPLDMASYDSVQAFARRGQGLARVDIAILNAGVGKSVFDIIPATGHEETIQINHISTLLLAILLIPILQKNPSGPAQLTIVNSVTAQLCKFPNRGERPLLSSFDDTKIVPFDHSERYGVSKLLNQLCIVRLSEYVDPVKHNVIINMVDPGLTKGTSLSRHTTGFVAVAARIFFGIAGRPVNRGAATYVDAVMGHGKEAHGCFLMNCKIAPLSKWYYSDGKTVTELLWEETLKELSFAGVDQIIASLH